MYALDVLHVADSMTVLCKACMHVIFILWRTFGIQRSKRSAKWVRVRRGEGRGGKGVTLNGGTSSAYFGFNLRSASE
jgi:hypothetical protein